MKLTVRMLKHIGTQIDRGNTATALAIADNYLESNSPLRAALLMKAKAVRAESKQRALINDRKLPKVFDRKMRAANRRLPPALCRFRIAHRASADLPRLRA